MKKCRICSQPAKWSCRTCQQVYYCNSQHAKRDWSTQHRIECHVMKEGRIYAQNIESQTQHNQKQVALVFSETEAVGSRLQVGLSHVETDIPWETHDALTQFIRVEQGFGYIEMKLPELDDVLVVLLSPGTAVIIPQGVPHHIVNDAKPHVPTLKLYSIYAKDSTTPNWTH